MLFKYLVRSVMLYGAEIQRWKERKELEKIMLDYLRWIYKLEFCTPRYLITSKLGLKKLKVQWGIRARKEKKTKDIEKNKWVKVYWTEKQKDEWNDLYKREKEKYYS